MRKRFKRQEWWKKLRLKRKLKWRRPRGSKNPMRRKVRGRPPLPEVGYGSPRSRRGLHPTGLVDVLVHNPSQLDALDPEKHIVRIGRTVGRRKRTLIIQKAEKVGLKVVQSAGNSKKDSE